MIDNTQPALKIPIGIGYEFVLHEKILPKFGIMTRSITQATWFEFVWLSKGHSYENYALDVARNFGFQIPTEFPPPALSMSTEDCIMWIKENLTLVFAPEFMQSIGNPLMPLRQPPSERALADVLQAFSSPGMPPFNAATYLQVIKSLW